jgi:hypothetical protein
LLGGGESLGVRARRLQRLRAIELPSANGEKDSDESAKQPWPVPLGEGKHTVLAEALIDLLDKAVCIVGHAPLLPARLWLG